MRSVISTAVVASFLIVTCVPYAGRPAAGGAADAEYAGCAGGRDGGEVQ